MVTTDCVILICVEKSGEQRSKCSAVGVGSHGREMGSCGGEEVGCCAVVERRWWVAVVERRCGGEEVVGSCGGEEVWWRGGGG